MKPEFDAKAYRLAYHKAKRPKKVKVINFNLYNSWKEDDGIHYSKFVCIKCLVSKESPFFYISSLRFCKSSLNFSILSCKSCHNKRKKSDATILRNSKSKSSKVIPESMKKWFQEEKQKASEKNLVPLPLIIATATQLEPIAELASPLDSSNSISIPPTLSDTASP